MAFGKEFESHFLTTVFTFTGKSVDYEEASELGQEWLTCSQSLSLLVVSDAIVPSSTIFMLYTHSSLDPRHE